MRAIWGSSVVTLLVATSSGVFAADMRPAMMPPPVYNWTGFYIGGNLGGAGAHTTLTDDFTGQSFVAGAHSGFIGGGQIGYNWQVSPLYVIGIEWIFDGTDTSSSGGGVSILNTQVQGSVHTDWVSTLAARLGFVSNNWLFYGKIGGGWVRNSATVTATFANGAVASVSGSNTNSGWTAGLGAEYGFTHNWTIKAEWDFIGLNSWNLGATPLAVGFVGDRFNAHRDINMFTVGANYKF